MKKKDTSGTIQQHAETKEYSLQDSIGFVENFKPGTQLAEVRDNHCSHRMLQADRRADLHRLLGPWLQRLESDKLGRKVRWSIDVDPQEMF